MWDRGEENGAGLIVSSRYNLVSFEYSPIGRLTLKTDQQDDTCQHTYDLTGHPNGPLAGQSDTDTFTYSPASRILTATSGRYNNTITFTHDPAGRRLTESLTVDFGTPQTYTVASSYDAAGRRTQITYPDGTTVTRTYTERDQLSQIDYNGDMVATYTHDSSGRRTTRTLGDTPNTQTQWQYTRADNLTTAIQSDIPGTSFTYTYDANKNKLTETISAPMTAYGFTPTTYDPSDRLASWNRADANLNQSWDLSLAGDWNQFTENTTTQTRTHTGVHELTTLDTTSLVHDAKGNLTTNQNTHTYTWDFDNRMHSATVGANTHHYTYDALARRVSKTAVDGQGGSTTTVFVCRTEPIRYSRYSGQVVTEYLANATSASAERMFLYATYIDEPLLMIDRTAVGSVGTSTDEKFYYHCNSLYSVTAMTDIEGNVTERYAYEAHGDVTFLDDNGSLLNPQESAIANPFIFTGRRYDAEMEVCYYRARYYDTTLGRFLNRDPLGYIPGDISLYRYVRSLPLLVMDPSGFGDPNEEGSDADEGFPDPNVPEECTVLLLIGHHIAGSSNENYLEQVILRFFAEVLRASGYDLPEGVNLDNLTVEEAAEIASQLAEDDQLVLPDHSFIGGFGCMPQSLQETLIQLFPEQVLGIACPNNNLQNGCQVMQAGYRLMETANRQSRGLCVKRCCPDGVTVTARCDPEHKKNLEDYIDSLQNWQPNVPLPEDRQCLNTADPRAALARARQALDACNDRYPFGRSIPCRSILGNRR